MFNLTTSASPNLTDPIHPAALMLPPTEPIDITALIRSELEH